MPSSSSPASLLGRLRLRRVPELHFTFDQNIEAQDRVERLLRELHEHEQPAPAEAPDTGSPPDDGDT